jgi:hypothetical protein
MSFAALLATHSVNAHVEEGEQTWMDEAAITGCLTGRPLEQVEHCLPRLRLDLESLQIGHTQMIRMPGDVRLLLLWLSMPCFESKY